jgi:hypothetical protein
MQENKMSTLFGNKQIFAFEVFESKSEVATLRKVNIWGGGKPLTPVDNSAYLPSFIHCLNKEIYRFKNNIISLHNDDVCTGQVIPDTFIREFS